MSKSCCFALVLAVICLSLEADAQPTVDETMTCGSSMLEGVVNMVTVIASNQKENADEMKDEIRDMKTLLVSGSEKTNETRLEDCHNIWVLCVVWCTELDTKEEKYFKSFL